MTIAAAVDSVDATIALLGQPKSWWLRITLQACGGVCVVVVEVETRSDSRDEDSIEHRVSFYRYVGT